jgi:NAD(P)H-dependent nitrite reductase small subunit
MPEETSWHIVASLEDLDADGSLAVRVNEVAIALFRQGNEVYAAEGFCPHQGGQMADALVSDGIVTCPLHAWQFRLADGANVDEGPGLRTFPVRIEDDKVSVLV